MCILAKFCNQTIAIVAVYTQNQYRPLTRLLSIASAVSHAHLTIYQLQCDRITLTSAKKAASLVKTACVGLSKCVCGYFSYQDGLRDLVVQAFDTVAKYTGLRPSLGRPTTHPLPPFFACRRKNLSSNFDALFR